MREVSVTVEIPVYDVQVADDTGYAVTIEKESDIEMACETAIIQGYGADYEGVYTVVPKAKTPTVLPTNGRTLADNITVQKIPFYETSNVSGETVYIANEV